MVCDLIPMSRKILVFGQPEEKDQLINSYSIFKLLSYFY